jgi:ATP-dependent Clp protease protease subunit
VTLDSTIAAAGVLLAAGAKGKRFSLPNSRILIHQVMGGAEGQQKDIVIAANEITRMKDQINQILSKHTGQSAKKLEEDTDRDFWMTADEAKKYGIIDKIIQ